jgi:hypothetical protein
MAAGRIFYAISESNGPKSQAFAGTSKKGQPWGELFMD